MGEGSGRGSGRVGSDLLSAIAGRVGSGQRFAGSGRVGSGPRKVTRGQLWASIEKTFPSGSLQYGSIYDLFWYAISLFQIVFSQIC